MWMQLTHQGLIEISGDQSKDFLQGQLTCDLEQLNEEKKSCFGAYCDYKGRVLASFHLYHSGQGYYLLLNASLLEKVKMQLKKYAAFSKVVIEDATDLFLIVGYLGQISQEKSIENAMVIPVPGLQPRYAILIKKEKGLDLDLKVCFDKVGLAANDCWQLENIKAGIPTVYPETSEVFTPHMMNYDLIQGVSFNKGCYVGQEIIARTHHLGKLNRRMYRMQGVSTRRPKPGDPIFKVTGKESLVPSSPTNSERISFTETEPQAIGHVVDASPDPEIKSGYQLLAVMHGREWIGQGLSLDKTLSQEVAPATFSLEDLPYSG